MRTILAVGTTLLLAVTACGDGAEEPSAPAPLPSAAEPSLEAEAEAEAEAGVQRGETRAWTQAGQGAGLDEIRAGDRRILIHLADADRDLSATYEGPITVGDGTDDGALFRLLPVGGGQYLIEALRPREEGGRWCVIVDDRETPRTLGTEECAERAASRFAVVPTGRVDDRNRPTHHLLNDVFGAVQYRSALYVEEVGDAPIAGSFSFVDRGAA
jgi:hypothetical protein